MNHAASQAVVIETAALKLVAMGSFQNVGDARAAIENVLSASAIPTAKAIAGILDRAARSSRAVVPQRGKTQPWWLSRSQRRYSR